MLDQILNTIYIFILLCLAIEFGKIKKELDVKRSENYWLKKVMADEGLIPKRFVKEVKK